MSVLLRQDDIFESFLPLLIKTAIHYAPVTHHPHKAKTHLDLYSIPATVVVNKRNRYMLTDFDELI